MAKLFKSHAIDDEGFPLPPDRRAAQPPQQRGMHPPAAGPHGMANVGPLAGIEPDEVQQAAAHLQALIGLVGNLQAPTHQLAEMLHHAGMQQGYQEGLARAQGEVQVRIGEALAALTAAQQERHRIAQQHEDELAALALRIARRVVGAHLEADPDLVARIVQHTVEELEPTTALVVHVHPDDLAAVEGSRDEIVRLVPSDARVEIVGDTQIDRGGVILRSPIGDVDARIQTRIAVLETAFAAQRRQLVAAAGADGTGAAS